MRRISAHWMFDEKTRAQATIPEGPTATLGDVEVPFTVVQDLGYFDLHQFGCYDLVANAGTPAESPWLILAPPAYDLPVDEPDPVARLVAVRQETAQRKRRHDARQLDELMNRMARFSPRLASWSQRLQRSGRSFALNVSNVRGPDRAVTVLGAPVGAVQPLVEVARHHALRVAVLSVADRLGFGLVADPTVVGDLDVLAVAVEQAAAELLPADGRGA